MIIGQEQLQNADIIKMTHCEGLYNLGRIKRSQTSLIYGISNIKNIPLTGAWKNAND